MYFAGLRGTSVRSELVLLCLVVERTTFEVSAPGPAEVEKNQPISGCTGSPDPADWVVRTRNMGAEARTRRKGRTR